MEAVEQRRVIEALILAVAEPISAARLAEIVPGCAPASVKDRINELNTEYQEQDRSFEIWEVAGGYQIRTRAEFSGYLQRLRKERPLRLSRAALETLAIVAYNQPATRAEVDEVRGVDSGAVLKGLLERRLVRLAGQREVPGRPMLYATTRRFLEVFGLRSLTELPELRELGELARDQGLQVDSESDADEQGVAEGDAPPDQIECVVASSAASSDLASAASSDSASTDADADADADANSDDMGEIESGEATSEAGGSAVETEET